MIRASSQKELWNFFETTLCVWMVVASGGNCHPDSVEDGRMLKMIFYVDIGDDDDENCSDNNDIDHSNDDDRDDGSET